MILVHYGEIHTKGQNRGFFLKQLQHNLQSAVPGAKVTWDSQRFLIEAPAESMDSVGKVFGVVSYAWAEKTKPTLEAMEKAALSVAHDAPKPLKVVVKRADKNYPDTSTELGRKIATYLEKNNIALSVKENSGTLFVELLKTKALVYAKKQPGLGGLPVGCTGKVVTLFSGGIDSPVASWLLSKRGVKNVYVHFHPFKPGEEKLGKIENLIRTLQPYTQAGTLYAVPYMPFTLAALSLDERMVLPVFRRFMLQIATKIAEKEDAKALATGDNLAQVASQTLENLAAIEAVTDLPVFRPLLTYDKQEIIEVAKRIGTYEGSLETYNDCCQSLVSRHPATKTRAEDLLRLEARLPQDLVEKTLAETKKISIKTQYQKAI